MAHSSKLAVAVKRGFDVLLAALGLLLVLPLGLAAGLAIWLEDRGPIFFRQRRVGFEGRMIELIKFRTMRVHTLEPSQVGQVGAGHPLVTRTGQVLRRFKVDELPQLLGVLRGELSLVGPRPTLSEQVAEYTDFQRRRLGARPGITGWAQVNGGTRLTWPERILLDVWYVDHWWLVLDFQILCRTVGVVLRGEQPNQAALDKAREHARRTDRIS